MMTKQIRVEVTLTDTSHEEAVIHTDLTMEWVSNPVAMLLPLRARFDRLIEALHRVMVEADIVRVELTEEEEA